MDLSSSSASNTTATAMDFFTTVDGATTDPTKPTAQEVWFIGLTFVTAIGLCAVFGILVMRCLSKSLFNRFITFFVSVGVGSLSGSAAFHLLPKAFGLDKPQPICNSSHLHEHHTHGSSHHSHGDSHLLHGDYLWKSFAAVVGIYIFFFSDKLIKIVLETRKRSMKKSAELKQLSNSKREGGGTENGQLPSDALLLHNDQRMTVAVNNNNHNHSIAAANENSNSKRKETDQSIDKLSHALCVHDHDYKEGDSVIATVAWMIIFGDGLHNFIDGVVIGASFTNSLLEGISVSVAVFCEEFPHELGDVAILLSAGMTIKQALIYNLLSALTCYVGFFVGVLAGNIADTSFADYISGFAGGMFLYISLACMMPEMKNAMEKALNTSLMKGLEVLALQATGVVTGLTCMFVMAHYEDNIKF